MSVPEVAPVWNNLLIIRRNAAATEVQIADSGTVLSFSYLSAHSGSTSRTVLGTLKGPASEKDSTFNVSFPGFLVVFLKNFMNKYIDIFYRTQNALLIKIA